MGPIKVRKPMAIFFDLSGTATKSYFMDSILFPYIKLNCATYLHNNWDNPVLQRDIDLLRKQSNEDGGPVIANADCDKREIQKTVYQYVCKCLDELRDNSAINIFRLHMWFDGYNRDKIETPVYSDVAIQIKHWRISQNIKLYVLSNGWIEATKRFMAKTNHGDLNLLIDGHFDTTIGQLDNPETFKIVCKKINVPIERGLFLTKSIAECNAAKEAGLNAILVMTHRRDLARLNSLPDADRHQLIYVRSFNEITFVSDNESVSMDSKVASATSTGGGGTSGRNLHESTCVSTKQSPATTPTSQTMQTVSKNSTNSQKSSNMNNSSAQQTPTSSSAAAAAASNTKSSTKQSNLGGSFQSSSKSSFQNSNTSQKQHQSKSSKMSSSGVSNSSASSVVSSASMSATSSASGQNSKSQQSTATSKMSSSKSK